MFKTLANAWKMPDIRKKILFTLLMLLIYRIGAYIPVPGVNVEFIQKVVGDYSILEFLNLFSGGSLANMTIFALGIVPYINASIIMNLLTVAIPKLERMAKEGDDGRKKIASITRVLGVVLGLVQAIGILISLINLGAAQGMSVVEPNANWFTYVTIIVCLTAGTALIMWIGERITENGIGNGISLLIFISIISRVPAMIQSMISSVQEGSASFWSIVLVAALAFVIVLGITFVDLGERRIPVQYAKRVVGRKMYGGQSTHIPMKVNQSGVMPIIFAMAFMSLPNTLSLFVEPVANPEGASVGAKIYYYFIAFFKTQSYGYAALYFILIVAFNYFYVSMQYNPVEIANNLRQSNGGIPGIRPGKPTSDYIQRILSKITLTGAIFLGLIAIFPIFFARALPDMSGLSMGGTSILIVVSVALETVRTMESQMMMRHHKGFLG